MQKDNRHTSFSLYISVLAVTDTVCLLIGELITHVPVSVLFAEVEVLGGNDMLISYSCTSWMRMANDVYPWPLGIEVACSQSGIYINEIVNH